MPRLAAAGLRFGDLPEILGKTTARARAGCSCVEEPPEEARAWRASWVGRVGPQGFTRAEQKALVGDADAYSMATPAGGKESSANEGRFPPALLPLERAVLAPAPPALALKLVGLVPSRLVSNGRLLD